MGIVIKSCLNCEYNFDGICANHTLNNPDTYGSSIDECMKRFSPFDYCNGYRIEFNLFVKSLKG